MKNQNLISVNLFVFILLFFTVPLLSQESLSELATIPESDGPFEVEIGYNVINITDIDEKEETIDFDGAIYMRWKDERLAYHTADSLEEIDYSKTPEITYQGNFRVDELYDGWRPFVYIPNGIGNRNVTNKSIFIWPDGTMQYRELFQVKVESPMNLRLFPFDKQNIIIYFHFSSYIREEVIFVPNNSLSSTWLQNMGIAGWERTGDEMQERATNLQVHAGGTRTKSEFLISLDVRRKPMHIILSIIFPMVLLVSLTWIVFWLDKQSVTDRISILFIGILSVVAYYLVIQDTIPEIDYLTLIDAFVVESFLILAASVIVTLIIGKLDQTGKAAIGDKLDRICRWAFPTSYVSITLIVYIIFAYII